MSPAAYRARYAIMQMRSVCKHVALRNPEQAHRAQSAYRDYADALDVCSAEERDWAFGSLGDATGAL